MMKELIFGWTVPLTGPCGLGINFTHLKVCLHCTSSSYFKRLRKILFSMSTWAIVAITGKKLLEVHMLAILCSMWQERLCKECEPSVAKEMLAGLQQGFAQLYKHHACQIELLTSNYTCTSFQFPLCLCQQTYFGVVNGDKRSVDVVSPSGVQTS